MAGLLAAVPDERLAADGAVEAGPGGAAVGGGLDVQVVVVRPRCRSGPSRSSAAVVAPVRSTVVGQGVRRGRRRWSTTTCFSPANGLAVLEGDGLLRAGHDHAAWALAELYSCGPRSSVRGLAGHRRPRSRASPAAACPTPTGRRPGCRSARPCRAEPALGHQRPPLDAVLAASGVVVVGEAEVVAVLVGDGRQAAVLGLDRVVAGPDAGVADLGAAGGLSGGPVMPASVTKAYQRWLQMASSPWKGSPSAWSPPAWTICRWSM